MLRKNALAASLAVMLIAFSVMGVGGDVFGAILLEDGFDTSGDNLSLNFEQATRQGGTLGGTTAGVWQEKDWASGVLTQIQGDTLLVQAAKYTPTTGRYYTTCALTGDFGASDSNIRISYDMESASTTGFGAISIGGYRNSWVYYNRVISFGIQNNADGAWFLTDNNALATSGTGLTPGADGVYSVVMDIVDDQLNVFVDGNAVVTNRPISSVLTTKYVTMSGYGAGQTYNYDNLKIESIPEPATMALLVIGCGLFVRRRSR